MRHLIWNLGSSINGSSCPSKRVCVCVCMHVCMRVCVCTGLLPPPCSLSKGHTHFLLGHTSSLHSAQVNARIKYKISSLFWCCNFHRPCLHFRSTQIYTCSRQLQSSADSRQLYTVYSIVQHSWEGYFTPESIHDKVSHYPPVTEHQTLLTRGSDRQLVGSVKVVLLLLGAMDHLPITDDEEAAVAQVGGVDSALLAVQRHNAGRAAACNPANGDYIHVSAAHSKAFFMHCSLQVNPDGWLCNSCTCSTSAVTHKISLLCVRWARRICFLLWSFVLRILFLISSFSSSMSVYYYQFECFWLCSDVFLTYCFQWAISS